MQINEFNANYKVQILLGTATLELLIGYPFSI